MYEIRLDLDDPKDLDDFDTMLVYLELRGVRKVSGRLNIPRTTINRRIDRARFLLRRARDKAACVSPESPADASGGDCTPPDGLGASTEPPARRRA